MKLVTFILLLALSTINISCASSQKDSQKVINITVDETGYHPEVIKVPEGTETVTLRFKRVTDQTCAREVVSEEQSINKKLPLHKSVDITFDLKESESITYGCHMNKMHKGVIKK